MEQDLPTLSPVPWANPSELVLKMKVSSFNFLSLLLLLLRNDDWGWEDIDEPVEQNNSAYNVVFIAIILFDKR